MAPCSDRHFDYAVVGAGFAGAATASALVERDAGRVLLVEREAGFGFHASGKNAGMLRLAVSAPAIVGYIAATKLFLTKLAAKNPEANFFRKTGSLLLGATRNLLSLQKNLIAMGEESQIFSVQSPPEFLPNRLIDQLSTAASEAMLWTANDGVVDVHGLLGYFIETAKNLGLVYVPNTEVEGLQQTQGVWKIKTSKGDFFSSILVNAAGAWAEPLGRMAGSNRRGLVPWRRHLFISEPDKNSNPDGPILWNVDHEFYFRPESGAWLLSPGDEEPHPPADPVVASEALEALGEKLTQYFPAMANLRIQRGWACLRTKWDSGPVCIDWDPELKGFFWVAGLGGHGMSSSVGVGQAAAERLVMENHGQKPQDLRDSVRRSR